MHSCEMKHTQFPMNKIFATLLAAAALLPCNSLAQTDTLQNSIDRDVDVVNTYLPTISNPFKMQVEPVMDDTMQYTPQFKYTVINKTQSISTIPDSLNAASMSFPQETTPYKALAKLAAGNYTNLLGQLVYSIAPSERYHLSFDIGHNSMLGKVKLPSGNKADAPQNDTWVDVDFGVFFKRSALKTQIDFRNQNYRYYGEHTINPQRNYLLAAGKQINGEQLLPNPEQTNTSFDAQMNLSNQLSVDPTTAFTYRITGGVELFKNKTELQQLDIKANIDLRLPIKTHYLFAANIDFNRFDISVPKGTEANNKALYNFNARNLTNVMITPHFGLDFNRIDLRAGVRVIVEAAEENNVYLQPNISLDFNIADDIVAMNFAMAGDYRANSFRDLVEQNRYLASDASNYVWRASQKAFEQTEAMPTTKTDIRFLGGLKAAFSSKVEMHLGFDYYTFTDELFFVNKGYQRAANDSVGYSNLFGLIAENGKVLKLAGELNIRPTEKSTVKLKAKYYSWNLNYLEEPWYKPKFEASASTRFYPTERLMIKGEVSVLGERYAYDQTAKAKVALPLIVDINLGAEYYFTSRLSVFAELRNCAAQDYERWLGYSSHRLNAIGGVLFRF